ncbi:mariner Mos1 transposase [Trichonephila clavipes]|nr:mariner Mos1 transposase [Trichonephila clavipes]
MSKIIKVGRHEIKGRQQENRKIVWEMLVARYKRKSYLHRIVTGDEKWIYFENLKRNRSYVDPGQPFKSTARPNRFDRITVERRLSERLLFGASNIWTQQLFRVRPKVTGKPKIWDIWGISVV